MLCQAFTAAVFSCCLRFCLKQLKGILDWVEIWWLAQPLQNIFILCLKELLGCFSSLFWIIVYLYCEAFWVEIICLYTKIHLAASIFCHIISIYKWPSAPGSHACHHTASTLFHRRCYELGIMSCSNSSPNFPFLIILKQVRKTKLVPVQQLRVLNSWLHRSSKSRYSRREKWK